MDNPGKDVGLLIRGVLQDVREEKGEFLRILEASAGGAAAAEADVSSGGLQDDDKGARDELQRPPGQRTASRGNKRARKDDNIDGDEVLDTLSTSVKSLIEASEVHYKNMGINQSVHSHAPLLKQHTETFATRFRGVDALAAGDAESKAECTKMLLSDL
jgi:hypothetical protein